MNLPNKITLSRVFMVPVFVFLLLYPKFGSINKWIVLAIFCIASATDALDGYIARKYKMVTNFGKFVDPLADKLLVCSALICLTHLNQLPCWFVVIVIAREFVVSGIRLIAMDNKIVIAASYWGKAKTIFQMCLIIVVLASLEGKNFKIIELSLLWLTFSLTIISMLDYLWKNRECFNQTK